MILSQKMVGLAPNITARVELKLRLFDPVPSNLVSTGLPFTELGRPLHSLVITPGFTSSRAAGARGNRL
jgi:hypothetical protein